MADAVLLLPVTRGEMKGRSMIPPTRERLELTISSPNQVFLGALDHPILQ